MNSALQIMRFCEAFDERLLHQLHALYQQAWWTRGRSLEETRRGLAGSQICLGLLDAQDNLGGFARVLTDYVFKALIFDVMVREELRGQGLGDALMARIESHDKLRGVRHLELYCLPEMQVFYARRGFSADLGGVALMRRMVR